MSDQRKVATVSDSVEEQKSKLKKEISDFAKMVKRDQELMGLIHDSIDKGAFELEILEHWFTNDVENAKNNIQKLSLIMEKEEDGVTMLAMNSLMHELNATLRQSGSRLSVVKQAKRRKELLNTVSQELN